MKIFVKCKLKTLLLRVDIAGKLDKAFGSLDAPDDWLLAEDLLQCPKCKQSYLKNQDFQTLFLPKFIKSQNY